MAGYPAVASIKGVPPNPDGFDVRVARGDGEAVVIVVRGEVELATADRLRAAVNGALAGGCVQIVFDLAAVSFMDSTGLSVVLQTLQKLELRSEAVVLRSPQPHVRRVFEVMGIADMFTIEHGSGVQG